jgi:ethanolamine ammonia-lyase small subunit
MNTQHVTEPAVVTPLASVRARTSARILVGRAGPSYLTSTQLQLRQDQAAALDAVHAELNLAHDFGVDLVARYELIEARTRAISKTEFLMRPDLGRRLCEEARTEVVRHCPAGCDLQVVIGDGLSAAAVVVQVPPLLSLLRLGARLRGWNFGKPFVVRYCRVGVLNDVGDLLQPTVVVLLIGERPGLATAESLSAYMAYQPRAGHTDAERNLISNIHRRGVLHEAAAERILALAEKMRLMQASGVSVKEDLACLTSACAAAPPRLPGAASPPAPQG